MRSSKIDDVLGGARAAFLRCGFEGASVDAIAKEAEVSKATVYAHCQSKQELFLIVVQAECDRLSTEISRPLSGDEDARASLAELSRRIVGLVLDDDHVRLLRACIGAVSALPEVAQMFMEAGPRQANRIVGQVLQGLHDAKSLYVQDTRVAANQFIHLSVSGILMPRLMALDQPVDVSEHCERVVDAFVGMYPARNSLE